jgi:hypothetical protein
MKLISQLKKLLLSVGTQQQLQTPAPDAIQPRPETAAGDHSMAKATAVNALKLFLAILGDVPGPGVKVALNGLLKIIEKVQVRLRSSERYRYWF